jgi:hypothetical protein
MRKKIIILLILINILLVACSQSKIAAPDINNGADIPAVEEVNSSVEEPAPQDEVSSEGGVMDAGFSQKATETPGPTATPLPASWQDYPVIPNISQRAIEIYQLGIAQGNDPHSFSKIGDCQNITTYFLAPLEDPRFYSLGDEYAYLQDTIDYFYGSYSRESLAVAGGLNVARVLSPLHADLELCEPNESPLACEVRVNNPSIALVSLEENWGSRTAEEYETYLRKVIEYLIDENVLPILATKADNLEGDNSINQVIVQVAADYEIPLWNFWRSVQPLPNHGLQEDGFHLTKAGPYFDDPSHMLSSWPWRNLTALQTLDAVLKAVDAN